MPCGGRRCAAACVRLAQHGDRSARRRVFEARDWQPGRRCRAGAGRGGLLLGALQRCDQQLSEGLLGRRGLAAEGEGGQRRQADRAIGREGDTESGVGTLTGAHGYHLGLLAEHGRAIQAGERQVNRAAIAACLQGQPVGAVGIGQAGQFRLGARAGVPGVGRGIHYHTGRLIKADAAPQSVTEEEVGRRADPNA